jgi:hypothetical protein
MLRSRASFIVSSHRRRSHDPSRRSGLPISRRWRSDRTAARRDRKVHFRRWSCRSIRESRGPPPFEPFPSTRTRSNQTLRCGVNMKFIPSTNQKCASGQIYLSSLPIMAQVIRAEGTYMVQYYCGCSPYARAGRRRIGTAISPSPICSRLALAASLEHNVQVEEGISQNRCGKRSLRATLAWPASLAAPE